MAVKGCVGDSESCLLQCAAHRCHVFVSQLFDSVEEWECHGIGQHRRSLQLWTRAKNDYLNCSNTEYLFPLRQALEQEATFWMQCWSHICPFSTDMLSRCCSFCVSWARLVPKSTCKTFRDYSRWATPCIALRAGTVVGGRRLEAKDVS